MLPGGEKQEKNIIKKAGICPAFFMSHNLLRMFFR